MPLLTQYASFFISPFGERSVTDELNTFLRSHRIVNVEKKLIDGDRGTGWLFLVEYGGTEGVKSNSGGTSQRVDYREILSASEFALFDKLRALRKEISEQQGIPVYAVFTNDQIAAMVKKPPNAKSDLLSITGVGEARVKQYGEAFLNLFTHAKAEQGKEPEEDETSKPPF